MEISKYVSKRYDKFQMPFTMLTTAQQVEGKLLVSTTGW